MIRILICDDDISFASRLRELVTNALMQAGEAVQIQVYQYAEEISDFLIKQCDIAFLDIDFEGKAYTGLDIAKSIRKNSSDAIIIFVTNFPKYAPEGYEVQAFRYLLKEELDSKLRLYLNQAIEHLSTFHDFLRFHASGEYFCVPLRDISYIEAQLRMVAVHMIGDAPGSPPKYTFYEKISTLEESLEARGFIRTQKSYLVNMRHIKRYQYTEVLLSNGVILPASRHLYAKQKEKYILWKGI